MDGQLLVRMYNVGLGDCIYLRVPDTRREVHILIDCGNKFGSLERLKACIDEMKTHLPDVGQGKKRLDLLVVSHPHEDHHKGFEAEYFNDIKIERIWLSPAFDPQDPHSTGFRALQAAAVRALKTAAPFAVGELKDEIADLLLSLTKSEALTMLRTTLPDRNGIQPLYVTTSTPQDQLKVFEDATTRLKVLNPMADIDGYYLGGEGLPNGTSGMAGMGIEEGYQALYPDPQETPVTPPKNISTQDFDNLRSRMHASALAAADLTGEVANNLSVVLLLEWQNYRLLFTGDAEWSRADNIAVKPGQLNSCWNVMWQEQHAELEKSLDFLKIGHHGSVNATPWTPPDEKTGAEHKINQLLDAILPRPVPGAQPTARAVASTFRTKLWGSIPNPALMAELGRRIANAQSSYVEDLTRQHVPENTPQPQRTDLEMQVTATPKVPVEFIDVYFPEEVH